MRTLMRLAVRGFGIAMILCGFLAKVSAAPEVQKTVETAASIPFWSRSDVQIAVGVGLTIIYALANRDRNSIDRDKANLDKKIDDNHKAIVAWLGKIEGKVDTATVNIAKAEATCRATREMGACPPKER